jgi:hypothetical protein
MTKVEAKKLPLGLYRLFWKTGGSSLAAVGQGPNGDRWMAPVNWVEVGFADSWRMVDRVEKIVTEQIMTKVIPIVEESRDPDLIEDGLGLHTCPYAEEIHGDSTTLCTCDAAATRECAMDI